eukprot:gene4141-biopygen4076
MALVVEQHFFGLGPGQQAYLVGLGDVLLMAGGAHFSQATAIHQVDVTGTEAGHLHRHVDGRVAGAEHDATVGQGQLTEVVGLAQFTDVVGGGEQAGGVFVWQAELFAGSQAKAEEHCIELLVQFAQGQVVAQALAVTDLDAANLQEEIQFLLREVIHQLVLGDPVFIQAAGFFPGFENHHVMAVQGAAMGAGQTRRPGADHRDALAGGRGALERVFAEVRVVHRVTLQQADQHRGAFLGIVAHAGLLAEDFRRADPGATAAEDIRRENLLRGALDVLRVDIADERRDIDLAGARVDARRVVAVEAARRFQLGLPGIERRRQVGEMRGEGRRIFMGVGKMVQGLDHGIGLTVFEVLPLVGSGFFVACTGLFASKPAPTFVPIPAG